MERPEQISQTEPQMPGDTAPVHRELPLSVERILNAIVWAWLWLSDVMNPTNHDEGFWMEKARQLVRFGFDLRHPGALFGKTVFALVMWFAIDRALRRRERRAKNLPI